MFHVQHFYIISQRIRKCLLSLPLQDGQKMKEEAIERVSKHVILKTYDAGEDVIMKGKIRLPSGYR